MGKCGTYMGYRDGCRCDDCRKTWRAYHTAWAWDRRHGGPRRLVGAKDVKEYIAALRRHGWTDRGIADAAGVGRGTVSAIRRRDQHKLKPDTYQRILGVPVDLHPGGQHLVPIGDLRTLVDAMLAAGYSRKAIGKMLGYRNGWRYRLDRPSHANRRPGRQCTSRTYRKAHILYRLLARQGAVDGTVLSWVRWP